MPGVTKLTTVNTITQSNDKTSSIYTNRFFSERQAQTWKAALCIVSEVLKIVQPASVVDVGCGTGEFLAAFQEYGIEEILGIDGVYVPRSHLVIPQEAFVSLDLNQSFTLGSTYDLAVCLEVAEHLSPQQADSFIASLTRLAPIILFSAAIPYQGGDGHLNEKWPEYWADLFKRHGFVPADVLRKSIWHDSEIPFWYRQNMLFFCTEEAIASNEKLSEAYKTTDPNTLSIVHPEMYLECNTRYLRILRHILPHVRPLIRPLWHLKETLRKRFEK